MRQFWTRVGSIGKTATLCLAMLLLQVAVGDWLLGDGTQARQTGASPELPSRAGRRAESKLDKPKSCADAYFRSLQMLAATAGLNLQVAANRARRGDYELPGYWLFWQPGQAAIRRKLARIGARSSVIVVEDRICTRSVLGRGGRIRCLKWEAKPKNFRPPPLRKRPDSSGEPPLDKADAKLLNGLTAFVRTKGRVNELQRRGPLYELTKRIGGELLGYLNQPQRPTLCAGGQAMVGFYERRLAPLDARVEAAATAAENAQRIARRHVARALEAWKQPAGMAVVAVAQGGAHRSIDNPIPDDEPDLSRVPEDLSEMILAVARVMLPRQSIGHIEAETDVFARLVRAREAMSSAAAKEAPAHVRSAVYTGFRALEIAYYADLRRKRFKDYSAALTGLLGRVRDRHQNDCRCD